MKGRLLIFFYMISIIFFFSSTTWSATLLGTKGYGWGCISTLVEIDPNTGATIRTIGPIGYCVNGLEYDASTGNLYGSTSYHEYDYNGLIEINMETGAGTPIGVHGWGQGSRRAITNITVDSNGNMYGWSEWGDVLVSIDKNTGIATNVGTQYGSTAQYGLSFDNNDTLYLVNQPWRGGIFTIDPNTGAKTPIGNINQTAHHGDFDPGSNNYYGISGTRGDRGLVIADLVNLSVVSMLWALDDDVHTLTFVGGPNCAECEAELDEAYAKITELEGELNAANAKITELEGELNAANARIAELEGDLNQVGLGLSEIQRLLMTAQGQRESSSVYSGSLGEQLNTIIQMLLAPPGKNISSNTPQGKKKK